MTAAQVLALTGNEFNSMNYEELAEVTKILAEAARRRMSRQPKGPAYATLKSYVTDKKNRKIVGLSVKEGKVRISQKFKGKNKMSLNEVRSLRKTLFDYLKDPTSTKKGYDEYKEYLKKKIADEEERKKPIDLPDVENEAMSDREFFDEFIFGNSAMISFMMSNIYMYDSEQLQAAIHRAGGGNGYQLLHSNDPAFSQRLREEFQKDIDKYTREREEEDPDFFYT